MSSSASPSPVIPTPFAPIQLTLVLDMLIAAPFGFWAWLNHATTYLPSRIQAWLQPTWLAPIGCWFIQRQSNKFLAALHQTITPLLFGIDDSTTRVVRVPLNLNPVMYGQPTLRWPLATKPTVYTTLEEIDAVRTALALQAAEIGKTFAGRHDFGRVQLTFGSLVHMIEVTAEGEVTPRFSQQIEAVKSLGFVVMEAPTARRFVII